jgi:hypothetical protein
LARPPAMLPAKLIGPVLRHAEVFGRPKIPPENQRLKSLVLLITSQYAS